MYTALDRSQLVPRLKPKRHEAGSSPAFSGILCCADSLHHLTRKSSTLPRAAVWVKIKLSMEIKFSFSSHLPITHDLWVLWSKWILHHDEASVCDLLPFWHLSVSLLGWCYVGATAPVVWMWGSGSRAHLVMSNLWKGCPFSFDISEGAHLFREPHHRWMTKLSLMHSEILGCLWVFQYVSLFWCRMCSLVFCSIITVFSSAVLCVWRARLHIGLFLNDSFLQTFSNCACLSFSCTAEFKEKHYSPDIHVLSQWVKRK